MSQDAGRRADESWPVRRLLAWTTEFLGKKGVEKPGLDASLLLAHALGWKRIDIYARADEEPPDDARQRFRELVRRRADGCPTAYLVGRKEFYSLEFEVSPAVLIPRDDSSWLVEECLRVARDRPEPRVLDLGTGSGCLAVTVAKRHKAARVTAVDLSPEALAVAARNAAKHGVSDRITFLEGDLFAPLPAGQRFDLIVSNPPYVSHAEYAALDRGVRDFEPRLALEAGDDGLDVLRRVVAGAPAHLVAGGVLAVEVGAGQAPAVAELFRGAGFDSIELRRDYARIERVVSGVLPSL